LELVGIGYVDPPIESYHGMRTKQEKLSLQGPMLSFLNNSNGFLILLEKNVKS
jgi:hypothetical protein